MHLYAHMDTSRPHISVQTCRERLYVTMFWNESVTSMTQSLQFPFPETFKWRVYGVGNLYHCNTLSTSLVKWLILSVLMLSAPNKDLRLIFIALTESACAESDGNSCYSIDIPPTLQTTRDTDGPKKEHSYTQFPPQLNLWPTLLWNVWILIWFGKYCFIFQCSCQIQMATQ